MEILNCLSRFSFIKKFEILKFRYFEDGFYIKIKVELKNKTQLYITEYSDSKTREYSYHWQGLDGKLIIRWDNSPHHKNIKTYPHHKHLENKILESYEIECYTILEEIGKMLKSKKKF